MPTRRAVDISTLLAQLPPGQTVPASELAKRLGINRMALSRLVAQASDQVIRLGRTRATAYAMRQQTPAGSRWPLYRLQPDATLEELGEVHALSGDGFHFESNQVRPNLSRSPESTLEGIFPGLPWFLDDQRPQGFLGRSFAHRQAPVLGVPVDLNRWQPRDVLQALVHAGGTEAGDLLLGGRAVQHALAGIEQPSDRVAADERMQVYPERARAAIEGEDIGSSPGGEQPKFTATVDDAAGRHAVLVKFALPGAGDSAERWSDLLVCEHLALQTLRAAGIAAAHSNLLQSETHTFLEVERFDRTPQVLGRRGFVSLLALSSAFTGEATLSWRDAATQLAQQGWLASETVEQIARLQAFGRLIGNTDMHQGNLGFHLIDAGPLPVAPVYDMLPMSLAPSRTGVLRAATALQPVAPGAVGDLHHLRWAAPLAAAFWGEVAASTAVRGGALRAVAGENARRVEVLVRRFGG